MTNVSMHRVYINEFCPQPLQTSPQPTHPPPSKAETISKLTKDDTQPSCNWVSSAHQGVGNVIGLADGNDAHRNQCSYWCEAGPLLHILLFLRAVHQTVQYLVNCAISSHCYHAERDTTGFYLRHLMSSLNVYLFEKVKDHFRHIQHKKVKFIVNNVSTLTE